MYWQRDLWWMMALWSRKIFIKKWKRVINTRQQGKVPKKFILRLSLLPSHWQLCFLPIIFLEGFVGRLFREFGIVVAGAVLISAFVSLTLTPVLNVKLTRKKPDIPGFI